jgi:hypothetical protein
MEAVMGKRLFLFCLAFNIISFIHAQGYKTVTGEFIKDDNYFILELPYEVGDEVKAVFDEDTPLAVDIIEMRADGKRLSFIEDFGVPLSQTGFGAHVTTGGKKEYYIKMFWRPSSRGFAWNDGRGIIGVKVAPNLLAHKTNSYEISPGMKTLEIRYRILLPHPFLTNDELYNQPFRGNSSEERRMIVDVSKVFETQR